MRIGVDLGGTKIEAAVLNSRGDVRIRRRCATPPGEYDATLAQIDRLVREIEREIGHRMSRIGLGVPGSISPATGLLRNANSVVLNGHPLDRDLAVLLGRPVRLENDANCFALAEARLGAGAAAGVVLGVILGTGVGSGVVVNGEVLTGTNRIAGEWGHTPLPRASDAERPGPACFCGSHGCIETWASGPALSHHHAEASGMMMSPDEIVLAAEAGDATAAESLRDHLDRLGRGLAQVVNILDPDVIVLGGGLSNMPHLADRLPDAIRPHVFSDCFDTPVRTNMLGDSAGVIGAAWLWPDDGTEISGAL